MHFPQLPDPNGWDVRGDYGGVSYTKLVDDWQCSQSGPISDVHIWGSWEGDTVGSIEYVDVRIYEDVPDPDGPVIASASPDRIEKEAPRRTSTRCDSVSKLLQTSTISSSAVTGLRRLL